MLCYVMLCYDMLCYVMLCYVMLCYVMLCYVMSCIVLYVSYDRKIAFSSSIDDDKNYLPPTSTFTVGCPIKLTWLPCMFP